MSTRIIQAECPCGREISNIGLPDLPSEESAAHAKECRMWADALRMWREACLKDRTLGDLQAAADALRKGFPQ